VEVPPSAPPGSKLYAPIELIHVPLLAGVRYGAPTFQIVKVEGLTLGSRPRVTFKVRDRTGPVVPTLGNPVPLWEPDSATSSFVPRKFASLGIRIAGPIAPDYPQNTFVIASGASAGNPDPLTLGTGADTDEYVYTFNSVIPAGGTWAVGMDGRRQLKYGHYDKASDTFLWPYTGETVRESPDNPVVYVDAAVGTWPPGSATPRRQVVSQQKCNLCHGRLEEHGRSRHNVEYCVFCHSPATTDWGNSARTKVNGVVDLNASYDGIEERTVHFKVMNHRVHTGGRTGAASLEAIAPFMINRTFYDDARYPNDLRNCTVCHLGKAYLLEAIPPGAPPTVANETRSVFHTAKSATHLASEPTMQPDAAACLGCHATGATFAHVALNTSATVENCKQCHATGALGVDVAHGLAPLGKTVTARFASLVQEVFVPRCATTACHGAGANSPRLDAAGAYDGLLGPGGAGAASSSPLPLVTPNDPQKSYLVHKLRGDAASVGGSVATLMPPDGALAPADIAAIEAWISNGAPND
jgi:OmcA/MtrC family decaheme c-type cytochrome